MSGSGDGGGLVPIDQLIQQAGGSRSTGPVEAGAAGGSGGGSSSGGPTSLDQLIQQAQAGQAPSGVQQAGISAPTSKGSGGIRGFLGKVASDAKAAIGGVAHLPLAFLSDQRTAAESWLPKDLAQTADQRITSTGVGRTLNDLIPDRSQTQRQPGESLSQFTAEKYPLFGGALAQGPVTTFEHAAHPTQAVKDYSAHPLLGPLSDAATLALLAAPFVKAAAAGAEGATSTADEAAASGTPEQAAAAAARASKFATVAKGAEGVQSGLENVASGGIRPLIRGVNIPFTDVHVPGLQDAANSALSKATEQAGEGKANPVLTALGKTSGAHHDLTGAVFGGSADEAAAKGEQMRIASAVAKVLPDPDGYAAHLAVAEGEAPALAHVRQAFVTAADAHGMPVGQAAESFDRWVQDRYKGTLSAKAANLAADVAAGKNPELAARIDQATTLERSMPGGQAERSDAFYAQPGRQWQQGFEPNPTAVQGAVDEATSGLAKARKLSSLADTRATSARSALDEARAAQPEDAKVDARARRLTGALDRINKAKANLEVARGRVAAGEDALVSKAEKSVPTVEQAQAAYDAEVKNLADQVAQDRKTVLSQYKDTAKAHAEQVRNDMGQFFADGPLGRGQRADWFDNLPDRVKKALVEGAGVVKGAPKGEGASAGLAPDEWIAAVRREVPGMDLLNENQIVQRFTQLYDQYAQLRQASFVRGEDLTPAHLRNAGINDPHLEAIIGRSSPQEVAQYLADEHGMTAPNPDEIRGRQSDALAHAGDQLMAVQDRALEAAQSPSRAARAALLDETRSAHGADAAKLAGRVYDQAVKEAKVPAAEQSATRARASLTKLSAEPGVKVGKAEMRARVLGNLAESARTRVAALEQSGERAKVNAEYALENQPSRLRPALAANRAGSAAVADIANGLRRDGLHEAAAQVESAIDELPRTAKGLLDKGVDAEHFFHVQEGQPVKNAGATGPYVFKAGSEKLRTGSTVYDRTPAGQAKGAIEAARADIHRAVAEKIARMPFAAHLGEGPLAGATTLDEAKQLGYVPFEPRTLFNTTGQVRPLSEIEPELSQHPTTFIPRPLFDEFRSYFEPRRGQLLGVVVNPTNRLYAVSRLALSPSFIVGRIFGHGMLAFMGSSDPAEFLHNVGEAYKAWRDSGPAGERFFPDVPQRLLHSQATEAEYARMLSDVEGQRAAARGFGKIGDKIADSPVGKGSDLLTKVGNAAAHKPFQLAGFLDNLQRTALFMTERSKVGDSAALESSLRAAGEFDRMTPFERDYVRRVVPFWAWHRELTRIAFHLADDNPMRVAWTLHLGNLSNQPDSTLPPQYQQGIKANGIVADVGYLNPFNEVSDAFGGGVLGLGKIAGPVPKIAYGLATGRNPSTNRQFTGPGSFGQQQGERPMAPGVLHQLGSLLPQKALVDTLSGRNDFKRYDTGDVKVPLQPNPNASPLTALTNFLGTPARTLGSLTQQQAVTDRARAKAERTNTRADKRYKARQQSGR